ncbi:hypothetical protein PMAYCL1PPCAC_15161 [Pristionchus mayeri]|uniref:Sugar transporter SWEET1 n=1 Tax=Pristionchus mayeri TaxID=1317129 RepID=A0AAN5CIE7_9BILA|nr:hypothetical protein PMAYCL1PPCAC_15161 [Pristionchus mayeri]
MFEIFTHGFTFLNLLSILAFVTTVGLFFCGIPICRQIWKRGDTKEISGAPFLMGVVGGSCWFAYGWLKKDYTVLYVTGTQILLYSVYSIFYWCMTKKKLWISLKVLAVLALCATLASSVYFFGRKVFHPLGIICMTLNAADFAAPLAGLKTVIRRRATSTLPLPLCIANFLVSSEWFLYGILVKDFYLITPNGIGCMFATSQIIMFIVLPRKPGMRPPIVKLYRRIASCCCKIDDVAEKDVESDVEKVVPADPDAPQEDKLTRAHRWSKRVVANMAGEIESVFTKVGAYDQFGYSGKLNRLEGDETPPGEAAAAGAQSNPIFTTEEMAEKLREEARKAKETCNSLRPHPDVPLRRVASSPNLSE